MGSGQLAAGNCKIEVEDIGQGQQLVVLSATIDLEEGDILIQELDSSLSPAEVLMIYGTTLPEESFTSVSVKAYVENAPSGLQGLPGVQPGRLPDAFLVPGTVKPFARYDGEDGTRPQVRHSNKTKTHLTHLILNLILSLNLNLFLTQLGFMSPPLRG